MPSSEQSDKSERNLPDASVSDALVTKLTDILTTLKEQLGSDGSKPSPLRKNIELGRSWINRELEEFPQIDTVVHPRKHYELLQRKALDLSEKVNKDYQYTSMLLRNHGIYITTAALTATGMTSIRVGRKFFLFSTFVTLLTCYGSIKLVDYKWSHAASAKIGSNTDKE